MLHIGVVVLGAYFCMVSLWWLTHTTARYYRSRQRNTDFKSSVTFPCCNRCKSQPVDGILKIGFAGVVALAEFFFDKGYEGDGVFLPRMELVTISIFLLFSGAMDVLTQWGSKTFYQYMDFAGLALFHAVVAAIFQSRAYVTAQPVSSLHSLAAYTAFACIIVTVVEAVRSDHVLCPVIRSYLLLLQGTWWLHAAVMVQGGLPTGGAAGADGTRDAVVLLSIIFSGHAAVNFFIVLFLWLLVGKLVQRNSCGCVGGEERGRGEDIFLENRVHFNYHVLSRFDSETE